MLSVSTLQERIRFRRKNRSLREAGMTLIEILIVIAILAGLMAVLVRNFTGSAERAKEDQTRLQMGNIAQALNTYRIDNNKYPTTEQGLQALIADPGNVKRWRGPYIEKNQVKDPWDNEIRYEATGVNFKLMATPPSGKEIVYPEEEQPAAGGAASGEQQQQQESAPQ